MARSLSDRDAKRASGGGAQAPGAAPGRPPRWSRRNFYSQSVSVMRYLLPATALGLLLLLLLWPQLVGDLEEKIQQTAKETQEMARSLVMINPRYQGFDRQQRPFSVTAASGTHRSENANLIDLEEPRADLTMEDGSWVAISAAHGQYDRDRGTAELWDGVEVFQDGGFHLATERVEVDIAKGLAVSRVSTVASGPDGDLQASGFVFHTDGSRLLFTGPTRLILTDVAGANPAAGPSLPR